MFICEFFVNFWSIYFFNSYPKKPSRFNITKYSPPKKDFRYPLISTIRIQSANSPVYEYELNSKLSFFDYASNLGGIISMWFGLAVIDTHKLFKHFFFFFILIRITKIF
jgi:hypothetical protein